MKKKKDRKLPLISVIILNFNGKSYLERTIPPILELRYPRYEIVVVDNGSEDGSLEYIQALERIRLLRSPRYREKNYACNYAIRESRGDYILLLDCDIILVDMELLSKL